MINLLRVGSVRVRNRAAQAKEYIGEPATAVQGARKFRSTFISCQVKSTLLTNMFAVVDCDLISHLRESPLRAQSAASSGSGSQIWKNDLVSLSARVCFAKIH